MIAKKQAEELIKEYYNDVYKFCCAYLKNPESARDVTQSVFLLFIEKSDNLGTDRIRSWLFTAAFNKLREYGRDEIIQSKLCPLNENLIPAEEIPDYILDLEEPVDPNLVEYTKSKLLSKLKPEERELLIGIYEKHMNFSEIGSELGISANAVSTRHFRLRKKIEDMAKSAFIILIFALIKLKLL